MSEPLYDYSDMITPIRSEEELQSFTDYCHKHPEERFWQALRNWSGWNYVLVSQNNLSDDEVDGKVDYKDTFYWEGIKDPPWEQTEDVEHLE